MTSREPIRFYRVLDDETPTIEDFMSDEALGEPPPVNADQATLRMWQGVSVYATETQARNKALRLPIGNFIAELTIPPDAAVTALRTGGKRARGHYTLWGSPEEIMRWITRVVPVREGR